jgi:adenylate kinase
VLVLTGNPGVGKHTVSKILAETLGYKIIDVNKEAVKIGMSEDNDSIDVDVEKTKKLLEEKISDKSLLVGHLAPFVVSKELVSAVIVLRKNPYELIDIYEKRNYSDKKKNDNLGSEILGIIAYDSIQNLGENKTFQINVTSITAEETAKKIESVINKTSKGDVIDWLTDIAQKNDLKKFFPD